MPAPPFRYLFTPMTVRNRLVVPGHAALFTPPDGLPTERMLHYWLAKARGGVGLISTHVHNWRRKLGSRATRHLFRKRRTRLSCSSQRTPCHLRRC